MASAKLHEMIGRLLCLATAVSLTLWVQDPVEAARRFHMTHRDELLGAFKSLLEIPNVAADPAGLNRSAQTLVELLQGHGCTARLLSVPVVYGERRTSGAPVRLSSTLTTTDNR